MKHHDRHHEKHKHKEHHEKHHSEEKAHSGKMHNMPEQKAKWRRAYSPHGPRGA